MKDEYYFAREVGNIPRYCFPDTFVDASPSHIFTYPNAPLAVQISLQPEKGHKVPDVFMTPNFALKKSLFDQVQLTGIYGVNWVPVILYDQGQHDFMMLQIANEYKVLDTQLSEFEYYEEDDDGLEMATGVYKLVICQDFLQQVPKEKRLILLDSVWGQDIFFHKDIMDKIKTFAPVNLDFIPAEDFKEL